MKGGSYTFFRDRPEWSDVKPLKQDESPRNIVRIAYSDDFIDAHDYLRSVMAVNELSLRTLELTTEVLQMNAANYTVWAYRRDILLALNISLSNEHHFVRSLLYDHPKNYQLWYQLQWLLEQFVKGKDTKSTYDDKQSELYQLISKELTFVNKIIINEPKNYHTWQYRRWLVDLFNVPCDMELDFCNSMLIDDAFNNSAWNHRYYSVVKEGFNDTNFEREIEYAKSFIRSAPHNESACNYLLGIIQPLPKFVKSDKGDLKTEDVMPSEENLLKITAFVEQTIANSESETRVIQSMLVEILFDRLRLQIKSSDKSEIQKEKSKQILEQIFELLDRLGLEMDRVRINYWTYRRNQAKEMANQLDISV